MIRFVKRFLSAIKAWAPRTLASQSWVRHHQHMMGIQLFGGRLSRALFTWANVGTLVRVFTYSNLLMLGLVFLTSLIIRGSLDLAGHLGYYDYVSYFPREACTSILVWVFQLSLLWNALVCLNHFSDLAHIFSDLNIQSLTEALGSVGGYLYVTNWVFFREFLNLLMYDPTHLSNARLVQEFILLRDVIGGSASSIWSFIISIKPEILLIPLTWLGGWIKWVYLGFWTGITTTIGFLWSSYISAIAIGITPTGFPELLQPVVNSAGRVAATSLGISLLLFILRFVLGWIF